MTGMSTTRKAYLGDGAYVAMSEHGDVVLTAENGREATDTVVLAPDVLIGLLRYLEAQDLIRWQPYRELPT